MLRISIIALVLTGCTRNIERPTTPQPKPAPVNLACQQARTIDKNAACLPLRTAVAGVPDIALARTKLATGGKIFGTVGAGAESGLSRTWVEVTGSTAAVTFPGNAQLGDSTEFDLHTINGYTTVGGFGPAGGALHATYTGSGSGSISLRMALQGSVNGDFSTQSGVAVNYGVYGQSSATRSIGTEVLRNVGGGFTASGGQENFALLTQSGDNSFNTVSGSSTFQRSLLAVDSLYTGGAEGVADTLVSGFYRPERGYTYHYNWLDQSDALNDGGACVNNIWCQNEVGSTLAYATATQTSPRGISETVGQLTCTSGGTACSAGGSDYRYNGSEGSAGVGSIPYTDARNKTVTFSVWLKTSSSTSDATVSIYRDGAVEETEVTCAIKATTWTRCTVVKTLSNTALVDNSEIIVSIEPRTTIAIYLWGAQLEESAAATAYQTRTSMLNQADGAIQLPNTWSWTNVAAGYLTGGTETDQQTWIRQLHIGGEPGGCTDPSGCNNGGFDNGTTPANWPTTISSDGLIESRALALSHGIAAGGTIAATDGFAGINHRVGTHFEWSDEWLYRSIANSTTVGDLYWANFAAGVMNADALCSERMGCIQTSTSTSATGAIAISTNPQGFDFSQYTSTAFEWIGSFPTLSTSTEEYTGLVGYWDVPSALAQVDGCYFLYDRGSVAADPTTGDTGANAIGGDVWSIWCSSNSTRTGYLLDGTASEDSFTTVNSPIVAATYYVLKVVMEGTTKARFYINDVEVGRIITNIPSGSTRATGAGFTLRKSAGTVARTMNIDFTKLVIEPTAAR